MKIERGIKALEFIKEECANGRKISGQRLAKDFKVSQKFLASAMKLGYVERKTNGIYKWKVGDVIPVMAKKCMEEANAYFTEKNRVYQNKKKGATDQATDQVGEIKSVKFLDMQDYLGFDKLKQENESLKRLIDSLSEKLRDNKVLLKDCSNRCKELQSELDLESDACKKWYRKFIEVDVEKNGLKLEKNKLKEENERLKESSIDLRKSETKRSIKILGITVFQTVVTSKS